MIKLEQLLRPAGQESNTTLDRPLEHLMACHRRIEERLDTLERAGLHLESNRDEALEAIGNCFHFFESNGVWHTEDEERSLFPRMRPALAAEEAAYLAELERQHGEAEALYGRLKEVVAGFRERPAAAEYRELITKLAALYRTHIASEDSTLTALGARALDAKALAEIASEMKRRRGLI